MSRAGEEPMPENTNKRSERRCADLIATVRRLGPAQLGGVYLVPPGSYSQDEIRVAQESCDRLCLGWQIREGTITMGGPTSVEFVR